MSRPKSTLKGMMDLDGMRAHSVLGRLEDIAVPTQIIWGRQDNRSRVANAEAAALRIRDCELVVFDECGHLPYAEYPDKFNAALGGFLAKRTG